MRPAGGCNHRFAQCVFDSGMPDQAVSRHARHLVYRQQRRADLYRRRRRHFLPADGAGISRSGGGQSVGHPHAGGDCAGSLAGRVADHRTHAVRQTGACRGAERRGRAYRRDPRSPNPVLGADRRFGAVCGRRGYFVRQPAPIHPAGRAGLPDGRDRRSFHWHRV